MEMTTYNSKLAKGKFIEKDGNNIKFECSCGFYNCCDIQSLKKLNPKFCRNKNCDFYSSRKKYSHDELIFLAKNFENVETINYVIEDNRKSILGFKCKCGFEQENFFSKFYEKETVCRNFHCEYYKYIAKIPPSLILENFEFMGYFCDPYIFLEKRNFHTYEYELMCENGHVFYKNMNVYKKAPFCKACKGDGRTLSFQEIQKFYKEHGCFLLYKEEDFNGNVSKGVVPYLCPKGHEITDLSKSDFNNRINQNLGPCSVCRTNGRDRKFESQKSAITYYGKTGYINPMHNPKVVNKMKANLDRTKIYETNDGKAHFVQGYEPQYLEILQKTYKPEDIEIDNIPSIKYRNPYTKKIARYNPDFYIKSENLIIEVKSPSTLDYHYERNITKIAACLRNGYDVRLAVLNGKELLYTKEYRVRSLIRIPTGPLTRYETKEKIEMEKNIIRNYESPTIKDEEAEFLEFFKKVEAVNKKEIKFDREQKMEHDLIDADKIIRARTKLKQPKYLRDEEPNPFSFSRYKNYVFYKRNCRLLSVDRNICKFICQCLTEKTQRFGDFMRRECAICSKKLDEKYGNVEFSIGSVRWKPVPKGWISENAEFMTYVGIITPNDNKNFRKFGGIKYPDIRRNLLQIFEPEKFEKLRHGYIIVARNGNSKDIRVINLDVIPERDFYSYKKTEIFVAPPLTETIPEFEGYTFCSNGDILQGDTQVKMEIHKLQKYVKLNNIHNLPVDSLIYYAFRKNDVLYSIGNRNVKFLDFFDILKYEIIHKNNLPFHNGLENLELNRERKYFEGAVAQVSSNNGKFINFFEGIGTAEKYTCDSHRNIKASLDGRDSKAKFLWKKLEWIDISKMEYSTGREIYSFC